jgi:predicted DNA-binding protein
MGTVTVRVSTATRDRIAEVAREDGKPMAAVIEEAIRDYRRKRFFERLNEAVERTRSDPDEWADYQAEVAMFDRVAGDGLGNDDVPAYDLPEDTR